MWVSHIAVLMWNDGKYLKMSGCVDPRTKKSLTALSCPTMWGARVAAGLRPTSYCYNWSITKLRVKPNCIMFIDAANDSNSWLRTKGPNTGNNIHGIGPHSGYNNVGFFDGHAGSLKAVPSGSDGRPGCSSSVAIYAKYWEL